MTCFGLEPPQLLQAGNVSATPSVSAPAIKSLQPSPELSSASFRRRSPRRVDRVTCFGLEPSQLLQAGNVSATPSVSLFRLFLAKLLPWPALWPPTLAMKSQKPCSERWPLHAPSTQPRAALPMQPANRDGLSPASALPRRLVADLLLAFEADRPRVASFLRFYEGAACGESTKQHGQRATAPEQSFELQPSQLRLQAQNVSATPSDEIAAALASTMAKRSLEVVTAVGSAVRRPLAKLSIATARAQRSFGLKPAQLQLS